MANYSGYCRSNYFGVQHRQAFDAWVTLFDCTIHVVERSDGCVALFASDDTGWPTFRCASASAPDRRRPIYEDDDDVVGCDFHAELAAHLADGHVAVLMEIGHEERRYFIGQAMAMNRQGDRVVLSLDDIYDRAAALGDFITRAES